MLEKLKHRLEYLKDAVSPLSEEERNVRYDICKSCEHFIHLTNQCNKCGCFMSAKTYLPHSSCPVGKWEKVVREFTDNQDKKD